MKKWITLCLSSYPDKRIFIRGNAMYPNLYNTKEKALELKLRPSIAVKVEIPRKWLKDV